MKIEGDKRLYIGWVCIFTIVPVACIILPFICGISEGSLCVLVVGSVILPPFECWVFFSDIYKRSYEAYYFYEDRISIRHGPRKNTIEYDARLFPYANLTLNFNLSLGIRNSMFLVLSRHPLNNEHDYALGKLRDEPDEFIIIRMNKKNTKILKKLILSYPHAPYASAMLAVLPLPSEDEP